MHAESKGRDGLCVEKVAEEPFKNTYRNNCGETMAMKILFTSAGTGASETAEFHVNQHAYRFINAPNPYSGIELIDQYRPTDSEDFAARGSLNFHAIPGSQDVTEIDNVSNRHVFVDLIFVYNNIEMRLQNVLSPLGRTGFQGQMKKLIAASWEPD
ncbi:hypothetical protein WT34_24320 [Burkholderia stagnalis]|uniref:hypothetical protein n=1 Tax=Burkholderia stagnalis TaxID=1503054 RepID=UPI00075CD66F|nr:hypothetical protein [Burkholderia stagnalis]KVX69104.1 hypothetical protein WT34_24320 [Burkholderia stagnalis]